MLDIIFKITNLSSSETELASGVHRHRGDPRTVLVQSLLNLPVDELERRIITS